MRNQVFAAVAMAMLGACVGGIDNGTGGSGDDGSGGSGSGTQNAKALFDSSVAPLLTANCATCHVGPETSSTNMFLGADGLSSYYTTLTNDRAINGGFDASAATLLSKGQHEGPAWSTANKATITTWLMAELTARGVQTPDPGTGSGANVHSALGAEQAFVGCMQAPASLTDYTTLQAYQVANMKTNSGTCYSCHEPGGAGGQYLGTGNKYQDMYGKWQQQVFFTGVFQASLQGDGTYKIIPAQTKICNKGKEMENSLGEHPPFDCQQNNGTALKNLTDFVTKVQARVDAKDPTCAAPAFATPTP
ncbi:MAG TPA: hypothetical protein VGC42_20125 [Kofleriaceae bacterium]